MTTQGRYLYQSGSNSNSSANKNSTRTIGKNISTIFANKLAVSKDYGGLGYHYFEKLSDDLDKILQVDIVNHRTETRGSVRLRAIRLAVAMSEKGIRHEDIVVICSSSQADQTIVVLAALFIGAIVAPLDPYFDFKDGCQLMKKLKPKLIFTDARMCSQVERILMTLNYSTPICDFSHRCFDSSFFKLVTISEEVVLVPMFIEDPRGSVAFIMPTQGTTGPPKLVCLSHHSIFLQTLMFIDIFDNPDKVLSFFPLSLLLQIILLCVSFESTTTIFFPGVFSERNACKFIYDYQISHAAFGTDYAMKVVHGFALKDYNINCLKSVLIGASNTTKQDIMRMQRNMPNVKFLQYYFMTECGCITATKIRNYTLSLDKPGSAGTLTFNTKIKIVDMTTKEVLGPNALGEVYYKGDGLMLGYFKDNDATLASMEKGYFKTGDLGMYDDDGWFYFNERIEDVIIRDGEILCPSLQLEDLIISHPNILDAVVIGNEKEIIAILKKNPGAELPEESVRKFIASKCREKNRPTKIIFLDSFPKTSLGHVKRRVLRKAFLEIQIKHTDSLASINL